MKKFNIAIAVAGILTAGSLAVAPTAAAAPIQGGLCPHPDLTGEYKRSRRLA